MAPTNERLDNRTLHRRIAIGHVVNETDTRQWWTVIKARTNVEDASISALAAGCPQLTSVDVSFCRKVTDASISALATGCPQLTSVDVSDCPNVTDASISALATGCPHLTSVVVSYCPNVTDASISASAAG